MRAHARARVCVCALVCVRVNACMCVCLCVWVRACVRACVLQCACVRACVRACVYVCMRACNKHYFPTCKYNLHSFGIKLWTIVFIPRATNTVFSSSPPAYHHNARDLLLFDLSTKPQEMIQRTLRNKTQAHNDQTSGECKGSREVDPMREITSVQSPKGRHRWRHWAGDSEEKESDTLA